MARQSRRSRSKSAGAARNDPDNSFFDTLAVPSSRRRSRSASDNTNNRQRNEHSKHSSRPKSATNSSSRRRQSPTKSSSSKKPAQSKSRKKRSNPTSSHGNRSKKATRKHRSESPRGSSKQSSGKKRRSRKHRSADGGDVMVNNHPLPSHAGTTLSNVDVSVLIKLLLPYLHAIQTDNDPNELLVEHSSWIKDVADREMIKTKFRLGDSIGEGSFAVVHKAVHRKSKSLVAIKEVDKTKLADDNKKFIENEVEILAGLRHKNIIRLIGAYQSGQFYWVITELSEYGDIYKAVMADGSFTENMTAGIVRDVSHALHYIHSKKIVHRDIKLDNMLFVSGERVKLADFGVACKQNGPLQRMCGTLLYVAPEIVSKKGYGVQADMFSLGVATYAMLSGHFPFYDDQQDKLIQMIINEEASFEFDAWKAVSKHTIKFVAKLMDKDPENRYTSSTVLKSKFIKSYKEEAYTTRLKTFAV